VDEVEQAKQQYGRLVVVEVDGKVLAFKPIDKAKITDIRAKLAKTPNLALDILTNAVEFCCVVGQEHFKDIASKYPLIVAGDDSIADALMTMARGTAVVSIR
jgi:CBS domain-containing protein